MNTLTDPLDVEPPDRRVPIGRFAKRILQMVGTPDRRSILWCIVRSVCRRSGTIGVVVNHYSRFGLDVLVWVRRRSRRLYGRVLADGIRNGSHGKNDGERHDRRGESLDGRGINHSDTQEVCRTGPTGTVQPKRLVFVGRVAASGWLGVYRATTTIIRHCGVIVPGLLLHRNLLVLRRRTGEAVTAACQHDRGGEEYGREKGAVREDT